MDDADFSCELADPTVAAAKSLLGVDYLYPYQRLVVANLLEAARAAKIALDWPEGISTTVEDEDEIDSSELGRQIVILPTGAGKSLCFQLPALLMKRPTLVLYPILSLMADQERRLADRGREPAVIRGGQSADERIRLWNRVEAGDARFIIANPEVLLTDGVMKRLPTLNIAHLVLDEAHCVSEWGESFRPSYLRIGEIHTATKAPLTTAFTATASPPVLEKIRRYVFAEQGARLVMGNPDRPNIDYAAKGAMLKDISVRDTLRKTAKPAIVFCSSRSRSERLARYLRAELREPEVRFYHAGLERDEKDAVERWFFESRVGILTATCAYGMGVDKSDIRTVIHRDVPPSVEAYLQESGRAGRDGLPSRAILLWGPEEEKKLEEPELSPEGDRFSRMLLYAKDATRCRRETLMGLLGTEEVCCDDGPSRCDVCRGEGSSELREGKSFGRFIARNRRRYTMDEAARIAAGSLGDGWTEDDARRVFTILAERGAIRLCSGPLWKKRLTCAMR